jgi:hypothetical protein
VVVEVARRRWASWGRLCCGGVRRRPAASPNAPSKPKQARHYTENLTGRADALNRLPETAWTPAYDGDGEPRDGADVAELTGLLNLTGWPARTRVIARREVPHPGAQLRPVECNGRRITCFPPTPAAGNSRPKLRHRRRARAEDRIRCAKDTGNTITGERRERRPQPQDHERSRLSLILFYQRHSHSLADRFPSLSI